MIWLLLIVILLTTFSVYRTHVRERRLHLLTQRIALKVQHSIETIDKCIDDLPSRRVGDEPTLPSTLPIKDIPVDDMMHPAEYVGDVVIHADLIFPLYARFFSISHKDIVRIESSSVSFTIPELYLMSSKELPSWSGEFLEELESIMSAHKTIDTSSRIQIIQTAFRQLQDRDSNPQ